MEREPEKREYRQLLMQKQFMKLLIADIISRFGDAIDTIAYSWIMYEITGSESLMALVIGLNFLPTVLLSPFSGALVDRMKKRNIMAAADVARFLIVAAIVTLYNFGSLTAGLIIVLTLLTSIVEAFRIPAGGAILPMLLDRDCYTLGKAAGFSGSRVAELLGYMLAGGIIAFIGAANALWIDAATFLISALLIMLIRYKDQEKEEALNLRSIKSDLFSGFRFVKSSRVIQTVVLIGLLINFGIMPLSVFQTPYVYTYLHMGPEILSYIKILMSVGMMAGAAAVPKIKHVKQGSMASASGICMGCALGIMAITPYVSSLPIKIFLLTISMFVVGTGGGVLNVIVGSLMMKTVPKDMMGRMSGVMAAIMQASMPAASFLCSALAVPFQVPQILGAFGVLTVFSYLMLTWRRFKEL